MKKTKSFLALALTLLMMFSLVGNAFAASATSVGDFDDSRIVYDGQPNGGGQRIVSFYDGISNAEIAGADVLTVQYSDIGSIAEIAKEVVDMGVMLYIAEPECSAEDISALLSIPKSSTTSYQSELLVAYSIYKLNDKYIFANSYVMMADEDDGSNQFANERSSDAEETEKVAPRAQAQVQSNFADVTTLSDYAVQRAGTVSFDHSTIIAAALTSKSDVEDVAQNVSVTEDAAAPYSANLPSKLATETWNDQLNVYGLNNTYYGYINCSVYAYSHGTGRVNSKTQNVYDVLSYVKAYPGSGYTLKQYAVDINCNYTDFSNLQTTTLPSGISYSTSVGLSGEISTDGPSIGGEVSTSWTYNPESQTIDESSSTPRIVKWTAKTVSPTSGKAYDIAPGMRVASPTEYKRGAFSNIYCNAMILGISIRSNDIEVGGWF